MRINLAQIDQGVASFNDLSEELQGFGVTVVINALECYRDQIIIHELDKTEEGRATLDCAEAMLEEWKRMFDPVL